MRLSRFAAASAYSLRRQTPRVLCCVVG